MTRRLSVITFVACMLAVSASAQNPPMPSPAIGPPVQLQVVISRIRGEKKVASMPYVMSVKPNERFGAQVRVGSQIPVSTTVEGKPTTVFRDIGTSMDAQVTLLQDGRYVVTLNIEETAVYGDTQEPFKLPIAPTLPVLRHYRSSNTQHMSVGQTSQFGVGTDPMTGDSVRVDVTLTVTK